MLREQGDTKIDLGSTKKLFWGAPIKKIREPGEKGQILKGAGDPPLRGLFTARDISPFHQVLSLSNEGSFSLTHYTAAVTFTL